jgi:hypothetical protein
MAARSGPGWALPLQAAGARALVGPFGQQVLAAETPHHRFGDFDSVDLLRYPLSGRGCR